jgi:hypothetical protein
MRLEFRFHAVLLERLLPGSTMTVWRTCDEEKVVLSEDGALATKTEDSNIDTLVTSGLQLTAGKHYWEVEIVRDSYDIACIGVTKPNLDPNVNCADENSTDGWLVCSYPSH